MQVVVVLLYHRARELWEVRAAAAASPVISPCPSLPPASNPPTFGAKSQILQLAGEKKQ